MHGRLQRTEMVGVEKWLRIATNECQAKAYVQIVVDVLIYSPRVGQIFHHDIADLQCDVAESDLENFQIMKLEPWSRFKARRSD